MIIRLAFGTSTPTSITVVATSNWISPRLKRPITASFCSAFILPWTRPTEISGSCSVSTAWLA